MNKNILIKNEYGYSLDLTEWRRLYPTFDIFSTWDTKYPDVLTIHVCERSCPDNYLAGGILANSKCMLIREFEDCVVDSYSIVDLFVRQMIQEIRQERNKRKED